MKFDASLFFVVLDHCANFAPLKFDTPYFFVVLDHCAGFEELSFDAPCFSVVLDHCADCAELKFGAPHFFVVLDHCVDFEEVNFDAPHFFVVSDHCADFAGQFGAIVRRRMLHSQNGVERGNEFRSLSLIEREEGFLCRWLSEDMRLITLFSFYKNHDLWVSLVCS